MVVGWVFGGVGCHARSKGTKLSYKLAYLIAAALFHPVHPIHPDIIRIPWILMFHGHYTHFVDISTFRGYYLYWSHK